MSDTVSREQIAVLERRVRLVGATNFRDLGGYESQDGRRTRWHHVFRADALQDLTEEDVELLVGFGLGDVFDLRAAREIEVFGTNPLTRRGVRHHHVPFIAEVGVSQDASAVSAARPAPDDHAGHAAHYLDMLENAKPALERILTHLAEAPEQATVFHCTAGRDRTGMTAALLLSVLDVPREVIVADYALTTEYLSFPEAQRVRMRELYGTHVMPEGQRLITYAEVMALTLEGLDDRYGSPAAYLVNAGVTDEHQKALRHALLGE